MTDDTFASSDAIRSAAPLRHVQYAQVGSMDLARGGRLERARVAYETYGRLNERRDNAVLICHALSGDSHVARHDESDEPGWWELAIGPGKPIDTDRYFVICSNILGGCRGTTGPNCLNPATGRPYGPDFPEVTIADMVEVQRRLVDALGIERLLCVVGGSMGGMQVLQWAVAHGERVRTAAAIATAPRLTSQSLAFDVIGRNAITHDPGFRGGNYYDVEAGPSSDGLFAPAWGIAGLAIARMIAHITYLSREAMTEKFGASRDQPRQVRSSFEKDTSVASYLAHQGGKFVERFDANSYLLISRAMDYFDLGQGAELAARLASARCRWLVVSFSSDWLFPADQAQEIVRAALANAQRVSYCNVASGAGHDAFLLEEELAAYGGLLAGVLAHADNGRVEEDEHEADAVGRDGGPQAPCIGLGDPGLPDTSIYHGRRVDYDFLEHLLVDQLPGGGSVLDLGCGGGQLLLRLARRGWKRLQGVDIHQASVLACVQRGIDCVQADLNAGLGQFGDGAFDCVLLSRTLQTIYNLELLVDEILRVGRQCVVSFPNFAYRPLRRMLAEQGRAPEGPGLLRHRWFNTPNIRFFSIADFEDLCREKGITIRRLAAFDTRARREVNADPNADADLAVFVIGR